MKQLTYQRPHKLSKLHDELIAAGIWPERVEGHDTTVWLTFADDVDQAAVATVVNAHDATGPSVPELAAATAVTLESRLRATRAELAALAAKIAAGTSTAAERNRALELTCRASVALIRLELRQLDSAD